MKIIQVHCGEEKRYKRSLQLFFSGLISTTSSVVFIDVRIAYISFLHRSAHIQFSYISSNHSNFSNHSN